jgi:hypothetical protein
MGMEANWFDLVLGAGLVAAVALIAYVWLKNRELAKTILEEKVEILDTLLPLLESLVPLLPADKQPAAKKTVEFLKELKKVNETLLQAPLRKLRKTWLSLKAKLYAGLIT